MTHREPMTDESILIEAMRNDSAEAFDSLYHRYFKRVYAYCYQYAKSHDDAADWTQEVFVSLWHCRHSITSVNSLNSLIFSIARNRLVSAYRSKVNSDVYKEYLDYRNEPSASDNCRLEYYEFVDRLKRCIATLPPQQAKILRMSRFQNLTVAEIALQLHITPQTVRNQLSRALKTLRQLLSPLFVVLFNFL